MDKIKILGAVTPEDLDRKVAEFMCQVKGTVKSIQLTSCKANYGEDRHAIVILYSDTKRTKKEAEK